MKTLNNITKIIVCGFSTFILAQEMEVEGALRVTGGINAEGQPITNVGDPQNPSDAATMSSVETIVNNMPGLGGMTPERIYKKQFMGSGTFSPTYTVPEGKIWKVVGGAAESALLLYLNSDYYMYLIQGNLRAEAYFLPGDSFFFGDWAGVRALVNIFEYSIQSSGNEQGLDYVEP